MRLHLNRRLGDFWSKVDSQPLPGRPRNVGWVKERGNQCIAARSDGARCEAFLPTGDPFCELHMDKALRALEQYLFDRHLSDRMIERDGIDFAQIADAADVLASNNARVYFLAVEDIVKIGYSKDVEARVANIRQGGGTLIPDGYNAREAELLGTIPGGQRVERHLHWRFADQRIKGEWFVLSPNVRAAIDELIAGHGSDLARAG